MRVIRLLNRARVLFYLSQFLTVAEIAAKTSKRRQSIYYLKHKLENEGLINADRTLTKAGTRLLASVPMGLRNFDTVKLVRLHNAVARLDIIEKPVAWEQYLERVEKQSFRDYNAWRLKSGAVVASFFLKEGVRVRLTPNYVFLCVGAVWESNAEAAKAEFERRIALAVPLVEERLGLRVSRLGEARFAVSRQEYAFVTGFAERLAREGWRVNVYSADGKEKRVVLDRSLGVAEVEAVSKRFGFEDAQAIEDLLFDAVVERITLRGLLDAQKTLAARLDALSERRQAQGEAGNRREVS